MYTQEIICPKCGKPTVVNVLDASGSTSTPCQKCSTRIRVTSDENGKIKGIDRDCIIATACISSIGNEERTERELSILRKYRDSYFRNLSFGESLLNEYYSIAPKILLSIQTHQNPNKILSDLYTNYISQAIVFIQKDQKKEALELYLKLIEKLKSTYLH
jgi:hypothetical protein